MQDLSVRLMNFSVSVILFLRQIPISSEYIIIKKQLLRSSTSAGANYEEAQGGCSRPDFNNKCRISLKEMRESNYWLRIICNILTNKELKENCVLLMKESEELKNILGAICSKNEISKS